MSLIQSNFGEIQNEDNICLIILKLDSFHVRSPQLASVKNETVLDVSHLNIPDDFLTIK